MWRHLLSRVALLFLFCLFVFKLRSHIAPVNYYCERFVSIVLRLQYISVCRMLVYVDARFVFRDFVLVKLLLDKILYLICSVLSIWCTQTAVCLSVRMRRVCLLYWNQTLLQFLFHRLRSVRLVWSVTLLRWLVRRFNDKNFNTTFAFKLL